jgi:hypothetical protein
VVISGSFLSEDHCPIELEIELPLKRNTVFLFIVSTTDARTTV